MSNLTKKEKIDFVIKYVNKYNITAYEIGTKTGLNTSGVSRILNGQTKNPQKNTVNDIYNYILENYSTEKKYTVNEPTEIYLTTEYDKKILSAKEQIKVREEIIDLANGDQSIIQHEKEMIKLLKTKIEMIETAKKNHINEK